MTLQTDDRQADHVIEKCVEIGGIACSARAILPKKYSQTDTVYRLQTVLLARLIEFSLINLPYALNIQHRTKHTW